MQPGPGQTWAYVLFNVPGPPMWHQRYLIGRVASLASEGAATDTWVLATPDADVYVEDLGGTSADVQAVRCASERWPPPPGRPRRQAWSCEGPGARCFRSTTRPWRRLWWSLGAKTKRRRPGLSAPPRRRTARRFGCLWRAAVEFAAHVVAPALVCGARGDRGIVERAGMLPYCAAKIRPVEFEDLRGARPARTRG